MFFSFNVGGSLKTVHWAARVLLGLGVLEMKYPKLVISLLPFLAGPAVCWMGPVGPACMCMAVGRAIVGTLGLNGSSSKWLSVRGSWLSGVRTRVWEAGHARMDKETSPSLNFSLTKFGDYGHI